MTLEGYPLSLGHGQKEPCRSGHHIVPKGRPKNDIVDLHLVQKPSLWTGRQDTPHPIESNGSSDIGPVSTLGNDMLMRKPSLGQIDDQGSKEVGSNGACMIFKKPTNLSANQKGSEGMRGRNVQHDNRLFFSSGWIGRCPEDGGHSCIHKVYFAGWDLPRIHGNGPHSAEIGGNVSGLKQKGGRLRNPLDNLFEYGVAKIER